LMAGNENYANADNDDLVMAMGRWRK